MLVMRKYVLITLILFLDLSFCSEVLELDFIFYKNDSVNLNKVKLIQGNPSNLFDGDYTIVLRDEQKKLIYRKSFQVSFWLLSDPPIEINEKPVIIRLEYTNFTKRFLLEIYKNEKLIFSEFINLCNKDGKCDKYESYLSCPEDCKLNEEDDVCIAKEDGICDPDCYEFSDPDCYKKISCLNIKDGVCEINCPDDPDCKTEEVKLPFSLIFFSIIIISLLIFLLLIFKNKIKKQ